MPKILLGVDSIQQAVGRVSILRFCLFSTVKREKGKEAKEVSKVKDRVTDMRNTLGKE